MRLQFRTARDVGFAVSLATAIGCQPIQGGAIHRVEEGETLTQIAHSFGVEMEDLLGANHLENPDQLKPGQKILIPGVSSDRRVTEVVWNFEDSLPETETTPPLPVPSPTVPRRRATATTAELSWPASGPVVSTFGMRNQKMHNGIDIRVASASPVRSAAPGKVVYQGRGVQGYGNLLILSHGKKLFSVYAYLGEILARNGTEVPRGAVVGTAQQTQPYAFVHFEIRRGKESLDPLRFLPKR